MTKKKSFEEAVNRLDAIVLELENSELKLDHMLQLYEEGSDLIKYCLAKLDDVENKISVLSADSNSTFKEQPISQ